MIPIIGQALSFFHFFLTNESGHGTTSAVSTFSEMDLPNMREGSDGIQSHYYSPSKGHGFTGFTRISLYI